MKNSKKKSPAKSKKTIKKNPLRKYQTAGVVPPALGSTSFAPTGIQIGGSPTSTFGSGSQYGLANPYNPVTNPTVGSQGGMQLSNATANSFMNGTATSLPDSGSLKVGSAYGGNDLSLDRTATPTPGESGMFDTKVEGLNEMKSLNLSPKPDPINKTNQTLDAVGAALPGVGLVTNLMKDSSIKDASGYYNKKTKAKLEQYNKKINASAAASSVGQGLLATSAAWGPLAFIPAAVGGVMVGASEGAKASYQAKQGNLGEDYDTLVANRIKYKESQAEKKQENLDRNAATNYYDQGSGLAAKYGGMREYQAGGLNQEVPLEEEMNVMDPAMNVLRNGGIRKYMGGGYTKVNGPSHENGGIAMDLSGDGVNDAELEGGEIIEEMKNGGNASKKYIWSDHLKTGGMSFAKKFEKLRKGGARPGDVETLRIEQEIAAKRDPSKLYAKYGGLTKYKTAGAFYGGLPPNNPLPPAPPAPPQERVSRTGAGKFFAEYGAPMASLAGGIGDIAMNLRQEYNPVETVNARELTADKIYIDRAKDKQAGFRESELRGAKRDSRATTGTGATQRENALRMISLRSGEEAAQNIYNQNRQASTDEQKINLEAQMRVDEANRQTDLAKSESRRGEGLRKESFENMRKKYIGSVVGELGNELASGMYRKEYINATLPDGVDTYELRAGAIARKQQEINPATGELYTLADASNAVLMQLEQERRAKAAKKPAKKGT